MLHSSNNHYKVQEIMKYSKYLARPKHSYPLFDHATGRCSQIITCFIKYCVVKFTNYFKSNMNEVIKKFVAFMNRPRTGQSQTNQIISCETDVEITKVGSGDKNTEWEWGEEGFGDTQINEKSGSVVLI